MAGIPNVICDILNESDKTESMMIIKMEIKEEMETEKKSSGQRCHSRTCFVNYKGDSTDISPQIVVSGNNWKLFAIRKVFDIDLNLVKRGTWQYFLINDYVVLKDFHIVNRSEMITNILTL